MITATLLSRSITIRLERKTADEQVGMWIAPLTELLSEPLRDRCKAWAHHNVDALGDARPDLPEGLVNRSAEVWWALLAIADRVGGDWPTRARKAAGMLSTAGDEHDDSSDQVRLLSDIRDAFGKRQSMFTKELLEGLNARDESPWGARRRGEGLDARGLSALLRPFKIRPKTIGSGPGSLKGYRFDQFADAFARHLPQPSQASHPNPDGAGDATDATDATARPGSNCQVDYEQPAPEELARAERLFGEYGGQ